MNWFRTLLLVKSSNNLKGVWDLICNSSNIPFIKYYPFYDNLQILDPFNVKWSDFASI